MRTILVTLLMILPAFALPSASAGAHLMTDPAGDSQYALVAGGAPVPGIPAQGSTGYAKAGDITSLDVVETTDDLGVLPARRHFADAVKRGSDAFDERRHQGDGLVVAELLVASERAPRRECQRMTYRRTRSV